jgi:predicted cupin superfamily sugar epimerase
MSTMGQTGLDCPSPHTNLVVAQGRESRRPDSDPRRNCLTSIYWVPTIDSSTLLLATNLSDHVHYYQGGKPFQYILFDPEHQILEKIILGPELHKGQQLQVPVKGGMWKCGHILLNDEEEDVYNTDYTIIGEAVAPGKWMSWVWSRMDRDNLKHTHTHTHTHSYIHTYTSTYMYYLGFDFHDFAWITKEDIHDQVQDSTIVQLLLPFVHQHATEIIQEDKTVDAAAEFYHKEE